MDLLINNCRKETDKVLQRFDTIIKNRKKINKINVFINSIYEGQSDNSKRNGFGILYTENRNEIIYMGEWKNDRFHGNGTLKNMKNEFISDFENKKWVKYIGDFKNGYRTGHGTLIFEDGSNFKGEFEKDEIIGMGIFTNNREESFIKIWKN